MASIRRITPGLFLVKLVRPEELRAKKELDVRPKSLKYLDLAEARRLAAEIDDASARLAEGS